MQMKHQVHKFGELLHIIAGFIAGLLAEVHLKWQSSSTAKQPEFEQYK